MTNLDGLTEGLTVRQVGSDSRDGEGSDTARLLNLQKQSGEWRRKSVAMSLLFINFYFEVSFGVPFLLMRLLALKTDEILPKR